MFGIRYRPAGRSPMQLRGSSSLRTIAIVSAQAPDYRVALIDTPAIDGMPTYHLGLSPVRNPKANRLRELWVGTMIICPERPSSPETLRLLHSSTCLGPWIFRSSMARLS
jgi:hypothetical protein